MQFSMEILRQLENIQAIGDFSNLMGKIISIYS
jgi:hypothetical protein